MHEGSVLGNFMPMFHTAGCGICGMAALAYKIPMVLFHRFDPDEVVRLLKKRASHLLRGAYDVGRNAGGITALPA
ncbi:MAG: hypothetical protein CM1200mP41_16680 [Gammaproteobacteria bacterium]|nr:MAG: hypothetical protein CM1200mP41_16680 [Gammaproteobacteria bacterium]